MFDKIAYLITTGYTYCWTRGLKITVSYIGNTSLITKGKNLAGLFIKILKISFYFSKKYCF
jgi:hypothetical protein